MAGVEQAKQAPKAEDIMGDMMPKAEELKKYEKVNKGQSLSPEREKELKKGYSVVSKGSSSEVFNAMTKRIEDSIKPWEWEAGQNATREGEQRKVGDQVKECNFRVIMGNKPGEYIYLKSPDKTIEQKESGADEWADEVLESGHTELSATEAAKIVKLAKGAGAIGGKPPHAILSSGELADRGILTKEEAEDNPTTLVVKDGNSYKVFIGTERPA